MCGAQVALSGHKGGASGAQGSLCDARAAECGASDAFVLRMFFAERPEPCAGGRRPHSDVGGKWETGSEPGQTYYGWLPVTAGERVLTLGSMDSEKSSQQMQIELPRAGKERISCPAL